MAPHPINVLSLCAGVGMLDVAIGTAFDARTVCYVEREAYAASQLVNLMEAQCLDAAPVWSDLTTFDAASWRGKVDCVTAGFPCQPHSVAGKREGLADERWIWDDIARIIRDSGAWLVCLDGNPLVVDASRANQLRAIGNGVVPLCAAAAFTALAKRAGLLDFQSLQEEQQ